MSRRAERATGIALGVLLGVVIVTAFVFLGSDKTVDAPSIKGGVTTDPSAEGPTIVIRDGKPVGGVQRVEFKSGDRVRFTVRSDLAGEIHVHGYDYTKDVSAGGSVDLEFSAKSEGIFEVELEGRKE